MMPFTEENFFVSTGNYLTVWIQILLYSSFCSTCLYCTKGNAEGSEDDAMFPGICHWLCQDPLILTCHSGAARRIKVSIYQRFSFRKIRLRVTMICRVLFSVSRFYAIYWLGESFFLYLIGTHSDDNDYLVAHD